MRFLTLLLLATIVSGCELPEPTPTERIAHAVQMLQGTPYVWGGESLNGADCSGAMHNIFKSAGYPFPRMTSRRMQAVFGSGSRTNFCDLCAWDFVWWTFSVGRPHGHIGLAEGDGIHLWQAGVKSGFSRKVYRVGGYWDVSYSANGRRKSNWDCVRFSQ